MDIPQAVEEITPAWLAEALRSGGMTELPPITALRCKVIGSEKGFLSQTLLVEIEYAEPPKGVPSSIVVKIEPQSGSFRDAERGTKAFDREIRFYREVASQIPIRLPRIYFTDASDAGKVLVMEDLSAYENPDQVHGLRNEQVVAAVREAAKVHATFWNRDALATLDWLPLHDHFFSEGYAEHWPAFAACYDLRIGRDAVRLGERVARNLQWLEERIAERPVTLVHGDLRADNLLFSHDPQRPEVVVLDWQLATRSLGAIDLARLLGGSEPAAERRGHQLEVFAAWHEGLLRAGLTEYEFEAALADFRLAVLYSLFVPVKAFFQVGPDAGGRTGRLIDVIAERLFASAIELDAGTLLP
jgi:Ecdysteroid kinase-like family